MEVMQSGDNNYIFITIYIYNMNLSSPGDMVLLFQTKAGWNQHGGPELLTFDNHDPKDGCNKKGKSQKEKCKSIEIKTQLLRF